ncbi:hypothetical protein [Actinophytocola sediminis]
MKHLSVGTWASIDESCPMYCAVEGSDLVTVVIGDDGQNVELLLNAAGIRKLVEVSSQALAEMDACFEREDTARIVHPQVRAEPAA